MGTSTASGLLLLIPDQQEKVMHTVLYDVHSHAGAAYFNQDISKDISLESHQLLSIGRLSAPNFQSGHRDHGIGNRTPSSL